MNITSYGRALIATATLAGVIATGVIAVADRDSQAASSNSTKDVRVSTMHASYPVYESVGELAARSTLVVRGTVESILPSYRVLPDEAELSKLPAEKRENAGYLKTDVVLRVEKVLVGPAEVAGTRILVSHLGGQVGRDRFVLEDEYMSRAGRAYLLFLHGTEDGRFAIVGGSQGRYLADRGKLEAVSTGSNETPVAKQLRGLDPASVEKGFGRLVHERPKADSPRRGADEALTETPSQKQAVVGPSGEAPPPPARRP